ncbi:MAG: RidA family protein [Pseudomonadota bacterium]|nr:RidA family protein [Pseudomonadota bacterium]
MDPQHINPKNLSHRSDVTVWNGVAYVAGIIPPDASLSIAVQTAEALAIIDGHLAAAGTDKSRLLTALIHMTDVNSDVAEFNAAWSAWLTPGRLPNRTSVEAGLQGGAYLEVTVTAAMPE